VREIASSRNPAAQRCRALRDAKARRETGLAIAEGAKLLGEALEAGADLVQVFVGGRVRSLPGTAGLLARLAAGDAAGRWECFAVTDALLERLAPTESPQGVLAVYRPRAFTLGEVVGSAAPGPLLLLDRVADPGNLGLILRTAEAAEAAGAVLSPGTADPTSPKCVRASAGSAFRLPVARAELAEAAAAAVAAGYRLYATSPRAGREHTAADLGGKVGFLLGQEGGGLAPGLLERYEGVRIPTGRVESLNVAMAAGILLYEARRQRSRHLGG
jgi:TrmH family RNA methyltransferase